MLSQLDREIAEGKPRTEGEKESGIQKSPAKKANAADEGRYLTKFNRKQTMRAFSVICVVMLAVVNASRAQLVSDGTTAVLSDVSTNIAGNLAVGLNGSFTLLVLSNNSLVTNSATGFIGQNITARSNEVRLVSSSARWFMGGGLAIGYNGAFNRLAISNGAQVISDFGQLSGNSTSASNNTVVVTGAGSVWSNSSDLSLGNLAGGNRLEISAGGWVGNRDGTMAFGISNRVLVTGAGSVWSNRNDLILGLVRDGSQMVVSNGGAVFSRIGYLGQSARASNNLAAVTGAGSLWSNRSDLYVGKLDKGNQVVVSNAGWLVNSNGYLGGGLSTDVTASNNAVTVTGPGSTWSNRADLIVGLAGGGNRLVVSNGATVHVSVNSAVGYLSSAHSNSVIVTDPGSRWLIAKDLVLGTNGAFNRLIVSNGGFVGAGIAYVGYESSASNNTMWVTGSGSVWSNLYLNVGIFAGGNQLFVTNGGSLIYGNLVFGYIGISNRLEVSNGGRVSGVYSELSNDTLALVSGTGSAWSNRGDFYLSGFGNRLTVNNGGTVSSDNFFVGAGGSNNRLSINSGGTVSVTNVFVGFSSSLDNRVDVNGGTLRAANAVNTGLLDVRRGTNVLNSGLVDVDNLVLTNKGAPVFPTFGNGGTNTIPSNQGAANPYPSTIAVAGLVGGISKITVTLSNLSHQSVRELTILLRSPGGQKVMLMSGAGLSTSISAVRLTFDDSAATLLPTSSSIVSGTNRPSYYPPDRLLPGVPLPYETNLSAFNGSDPNGNWSLYIYNNSIISGGSLRGWSVAIETDAAFPNSGLFEFNGGTLTTGGAIIDNRVPFVVGGPGGVPAVWDVQAGASDHVVTSDLIVGSLAAGSSNNLLQVSGGTLLAGKLDVRGGTNRLNAGLLDVDQLVVTNTRGQVELNGGSLRTPDTTIANGRLFNVGNGVSLATLQLLGGTHTFANNLVVANNGSLIGNGTVDGTVTVSSGGRIIPGAPIGRISVLGSVILQGMANLQIDKSGGVRTNDQVTASGALFYGGTLNVTDIGVDILSAGDRFILFSAAPYLGGFTTILLPPLSPGLTWVNNLLVDGSIEVVVASQSQPSFSSITQAGATVIFAGSNGTPNATYTVLAGTNVAQPLTSWVSIATSQFDSNGKFSVTNSIVPGIPHRFFRIRIP